MAIRLNRISSRIVLSYFLLAVLLFPTLYLVLSTAMERYVVNSFVSSVRTFARTVADSLESMEGNHQGAIRQILDTAVLSGDCVYAKFLVNGMTFDSQINLDLSATPQDFEFAGHNDQVYFIHSTISEIDGSQGTLILGYDETPTMAVLADLRRSLIFLLLGTAFASVVLLVILARRLSKPLQILQRRSRAVTADRDVKLDTNSGIYEIDQMASDLEKMRSRLVGANQKLEDEIDQRIRAEEAARQLELRLRQARRMETVGALAGGVAHEFNNLLLPMQLNVELALGDTEENTLCNEYLQNVLKSIERANLIVEQILSMSQKPDPLCETNLRSTIEDALAFLRPAIPEPTQLVLDLESTPLLANIQPGHLHQILINLINNALAATVSTRQAKLVVELRKDTDNSCVMTIADNGVGMTEELKNRAFDPFFTTRAVGRGTGLGLSVVEGIVASCGGTIEIESEVAKGTKIIVRLPLCDSAAG